jgi:glycosyltransferase involved in cell wall biosynthesis
MSVRQSSPNQAGSHVSELGTTVQHMHALGSAHTGTEKTLAITVVVPVKNEERNLPRCLAALSRFSEVIVADSGSTDATALIAQQFGARLLQFRWNGEYPKKRNWVLLNHAFSTEWVLFVDADEIVNERFCNEVHAAIRSDRHNGYWLNYTSYFLGRKLRFGVAQRKLALFRIGSGMYERIDEHGWSELDMEVHEHPIIVGSLGEIRAPIDHDDFRGIGKFIDVHREYAMWEAQRLLLLKNKGAAIRKDLTARQRLKYKHIERWWYAWFYLFYDLFLRLGLLDGSAGFYRAYYKAWYFLTIRLLIAELERGNRQR